ncbi:hypothetical protein SODALDRAFT_339991 [Sodiomyces alkalinus F11]|uniref:Uncharacterized protein n=1 Tax=Sodiomyces alkalinus (strain CBS 110278 / VKM F-3762 / F11) TaxID=1314773 RepID=A0A3N2PW24_SODAK|nr:hypothetical protein SODALDRAFT_339991 [Sodiomyces alkalinus F11]ROT38678.1 hypothetical protein SODALDRAFT_339991 [Sodiomyces alkalinus F11]
MAQSQSARPTLECEKIVQFCNAIVAGSHPKIKAPSNCAGKLTNFPSSTLAQSPKPSTAPSISKHASSGLKQQVSAQNGQLPISKPQTPVVPGLVPGLGSSTPLAANSVVNTRPFGSGNTEIDPVLLEKSDDLVKAEIQLQRQRIERSLREDAEQRRAALKASAQLEPLPDFDINDVLSKALTLVQASASLPVDTNSAANRNTSAASDSFDENSYYSSQHNSPDSSHAGSSASAVYDPEAVYQPEEPQSQQPIVSDDQRVASNHLHQPALPISSHQPAAYHQEDRVSTRDSSYTPSRPHDGFPASANAQHARAEKNNTDAAMDNITTAGESTSVGDRSREASQSDPGNVVEIDENASRRMPGARQQQQRRRRRQLGDSLLSRPPSPLVIAQHISPVAPQPFHVSPLAVARQPPIPLALGTSIPQGTSAQVAALRNEPNVISSPDSSPQGPRRGDKKKGKKRDRSGRKDARQAPPDSPYIKDEPQSPSPLDAPPFTRPQKRQKRQAADRPRHQLHERQNSNTYGGDSVAFASSHPGPAGPEGYRSRPVMQVAAPQDGYSYEPSFVEHRRVSGGNQPYPAQYGPVETYAPASVPPPVTSDRYNEESRRTYVDNYEMSRTSVHPEASRVRSRSPVMRDRPTSVMGPPRAPPARVVVDAYGRRYYEPAPPPPVQVVRQSVAPPMGMDDAEIIYERPVRAESRRPALEWEENGVIYRRASPTYAAPRRVITQPEYAVADPHRGYRTREYSARPVAPPPMEEYISSRGAVERRPIEEIPREYTMRATTARPVESVRYEMPGTYERVQHSVRPEPSPVYPVGAPVDMRREAMQPLPRAYSVRPAEPSMVRREFSARPAEQYYGQPVPMGNEVAYVDELPQGPPREIVYGDGVRQGGYR